MRFGKLLEMFDKDLHTGQIILECSEVKQRAFVLIGQNGNI